ncbi:MAG TPA: hypothetical protein VJ398_09010 [Acidimicrobiia bacterium]|jgi:hypothetical protein|nr:hypothetical protein [Acidimicrobiia bacterium]
MDGQRQRQALTAAERAVEALGQADIGGARTAAARAAELDQVGLFGGLVVAVELAASDLESNGKIKETTWNVLADSVGPGPIAGLIEAVRGG